MLGVTASNVRKRPLSIIAGLVTLLLLGASGCGGICGPGTVEKDGACIVPGQYLICADGFIAEGNRCTPVQEWWARYCGPDTEPDLEKGYCIGVGGTGPVTCPSKCPPAQGGNVCVEGQVLEGGKLLIGAPDARIIDGEAENAVAKVWDPFQFSPEPFPTPLGEAKIDKNGCFMIENVALPWTNTLVVGVDDPSPETIGAWSRVLFVVFGVPGKNSTDIKVPAFKTTEVEQWGQDIKKMGMLIFQFFDSATKKPLSGVIPLQQGKKPPFTYLQPTPVYYFTPDPSAPPYFDETLSATSTSGLVGIRKAPLTVYSGEKAGCTFPSITMGAQQDWYIMIAPVNGQCS